jgi:hypothetical protein
MVAKCDVDGVNSRLIKSVFDDIGQNLLNRNEEVIAQTAPNIVLRRKTFKDRVHAKEILNPVLHSEFDLRLFHMEERIRDWRPANRKMWAVSGTTFSSPKLAP